MKVTPQSLAMLMLSLAVSLPADQKRESVVCYLSWFNEIGGFTGSRAWRPGGYRYQEASENDWNYPLPQTALPTRAPDIGSDEFYRLLFESARATQHVMKNAGFDIVTFDMLPMPKYDPSQPLSDTNIPFAHFRTYLEWIRAAEDTGMRVGLMPDIMNKSSDYPEGRKLNRDEWINVLGGALTAIQDKRPLWRIDGKPVVIHFGSDIVYGGPAPVSADIKPDGGWRDVLSGLRTKGSSLFFIADARPHDYILRWGDISDGLHMFAPAAPMAFLADYQRDISKALSIPFVWTVSPGYYRPGLSYTEPDFARIDATYRAAMQSGAERIYFLTWNDFEERTDIAPSPHKGSYLLDVVAFYNRWFKTGMKPSAAPESVVLAYPFRISAQVKTKSPVWGKRNAHEKLDGSWSSPPYEPKVFYWANVSSKQTLTVEGIGTAELTPGVSFGSFTGVKAGTMTAVLNGTTLTLPAVDADEGDENLDFRYVDLKKPLPIAVKKIKPKLFTAVSEHFESFADSTAWKNTNYGGYILSGENEFAIGDNPLKDNVNGSERCLHITSAANTPLGKFSINMKGMTEGSFSFKVFSPCRSKSGPPYGYATWSFGNKSGALFHGDFYEYLNRITAASGNREPFGGYAVTNLGALSGTWHTVSGGWTKDGRVTVSHDGTAVLSNAPMRAALGGGISVFTLSSADVGDGKRTSDIYIDDITIETK
ncbi:MAG: hypothetical protein HZC28_05085 [Spirochaetes bacterium]|nr:hypothetical protein [Spirochaetota bacterium]